MPRHGIVRRIAPGTTIDLHQEQAQVAVTPPPSHHRPEEAPLPSHRVLVVRDFALGGEGPVRELIAHFGPSALVCVNEGAQGFEVGLYRTAERIELGLPPDVIVGKFVSESLQSATRYLQTVTAKVTMEGRDLIAALILAGEELSVPFEEPKGVATDT